MRQTGVMAACAAYALTHNFPLLPRVHALAQRLERSLEEIGAEITSRAETCMVGVLTHTIDIGLVSD
jgi:threonine aldolase